MIVFSPSGVRLIGKRYGHLRRIGFRKDSKFQAYHTGHLCEMSNICQRDLYEGDLRSGRRLLCEKSRQFRICFICFIEWEVDREDKLRLE